MNNKVGIDVTVYKRLTANVPIYNLEEIDHTIRYRVDKNDLFNEYIGFILKGDHMAPIFKDGDTLIIEVSSSYKSGDHCAVYINNYNATLMTVIKNDDSTITLESINPSYPSLTFRNNNKSVKILGKVVEMRRFVWWNGWL